MKLVAANILIGILSTLAVTYLVKAYTESEDSLWNTWQFKWMRKYFSAAEEERRKAAFLKNDGQIQNHNSLWFGPTTNEVSHWEVPNMFADKTEDEWTKLDQVYPDPDDDDWGEQATRDDEDPNWDDKQKKYLQQYSFVNSSWRDVKARLFHVENGLLPSRLDWRRRLIVPNFEAACCMVDCLKASYAWAVTTTLISHQNLKTLEDARKGGSSRKVSTIYSTQQLIDCLTTDDVFYKDTNFCKSNAMGGNGRLNSVVRAYKHAILNGLMSNSDYTFTRGEKSMCSYNKEKAKDHVFTGYTKVAHDDFGGLSEVGLMQALSYYGPITVSFNANLKEYWRYGDGVIEPKDCKTGKTVSMVLVGYGIERNKRYWLLMTPWGERFGRHGMMKLARLSDARNCNLAAQAIFPTWEGRDVVTSYDWDYWKKLEETRDKYVRRVYANNDLADNTYQHNINQPNST